MSNEITGTVKEVKSKDWKNGIILWNFILEGSPVVYNCGTQQPRIEPGDVISFRENSRKVDVNSIVEGKVQYQDQTLPAVTANTSHPVTPTVRLDATAARIQRQSARRDAVRLVTVAMECKLLPYTMSGKNEDKWSRMLSLIEETTNDLIRLEEDNG